MMFKELASLVLAVSVLLSCSNTSLGMAVINFSYTRS